MLFILSACLLLMGCPAQMQNALSQQAGGGKPARFMAYPVYYGKMDASNTMIFYHNPQCPYSSQAWPAVRAFAEKQSPDEFKLVVMGHGFDENGTWLVYYGGVVAEQNPALARKYMTEVSASIKKIKGNAGHWTNAWQKKQKKSVLDPERANDVIRDDANSAAYESALTAVSKKYRLNSTPSFVINGKKYEGERTEKGFADFMRNTKPRRAVP